MIIDTVSKLLFVRIHMGDETLKLFSSNQVESAISSIKSRSPLKGFLVRRPTVGLPSGFSTKLSHVQWGRHVIEAHPSFHHVEHGGFIEYLSEWCHLFYPQAYRPTHHSR